MTLEEKKEYLPKLYDRLLEHRYRYYVLADPVIDDWLHDWIEDYYNDMAAEVGCKIMEMVDFNPNDSLAIEAKNRVDSGVDYYSLWEKEMLPIWQKLGRSRKQKKDLENALQKDSQKI